jgi:hypothetical protein
LAGRTFLKNIHKKTSHFLSFSSMLPVALLSRVTFTTATLINRYCIDLYTHFSRLLPVPAVRFAWGIKRPSGYNYLPENQPTHLTPEPGRARRWQSRCANGACPCCAPSAGVGAARRNPLALPDPLHDNAQYASPNTRIS